MVAGFQNGRHATLLKKPYSTMMSLIARLGVVFLLNAAPAYRDDAY